MSVLSVDLASRRYRDFGFAYLESGNWTPRYPVAADLGLSDPPDPGKLAAALNDFSRDQAVDVLLLDGPQGWRHPASPVEHMRLSERAFNTPGKSGLPGNAKPSTYLKYIQFSVDVFDQLRRSHGWALLTHDWPARARQRWVVECFPSAAWSLMGLDRLPSRAKQSQIDQAARELAQVSGLELPSKLTHDELQASVVLLLGTSIASASPERVILAGVDPIVELGVVYEGLIAGPHVSPQ